MNRNCPVCGSTKIDSIAFFDNYPIIVFPVPKNVSKNMDCKNLSICMCLECYHQYQINYNIDFNQKLYSKYYQFYPYSNIECFIEHYRKPFEELFSSFNFPNLNSNRLLEVGLSDTSQLKYFLDKKFDAYGITPQSNTCDTRIFSGFYEEYNFDMKFNVIVSRFNLEHIIDLDIFLKKVNQDLSDNGLLCIQVPNTEYFMKNNILNFYAHEHIHYFNINSISLLLQKNDFLIEKSYFCDSPSIIIMGRKKSNIVKLETLKYFEYKKNIINKIFKIASNSCGKIIFYGAGLSLTSILYGVEKVDDKKDNIVIFDDNDIVADMFMPFFDIPIMKYSKNMVHANDIIILTLNPIYHKQVVEKIRLDGINNTIYAINEYGLLEI